MVEKLKNPCKPYTGFLQPVFQRMHHFPHLSAFIIFNSSQFCLQETTLDEDWPVEGRGACAWSKIESRDPWAASPSLAQEGKNSFAAPGHP